MIFDDISLVEGATIKNATVDSGTAFPSSPSTGELFFRTDLGSLFVNNGSTWNEVGAAITAQAVTDALGFTPASLDGTNKVPASQIPAVAITDTFVVATQAAMLALSAQVGDIAIRTDQGKTYILQASPATTLANWKELLVTSSVTPAGSNTQVQFNNNGSLGASANFTFDSGSGTLRVGGSSGTIVPASALGSLTIRAADSVFDQRNAQAGTLTLLAGSGLNNGSQGDVGFIGIDGGALVLKAGDGGSNGSSQAGDGGNVTISAGLAGTLGSGGVAGYLALLTNNTERLRIANNGAWSVNGSTGTSGQVLVSQGSSGSPVWTTPAQSGGTFDGGTVANATTFTSTVTNNSSLFHKKNTISSAGSVTINAAAGNAVHLTMNGDISTLTFSNVPAAGNVCALTLFILQSTGQKLITWPANIRWAGGGAPVLTINAGRTDIVSIITHDGGATWYGSVVGLNYA